MDDDQGSHHGEHHVQNKIEMNPLLDSQSWTLEEIL